MRRAVGNRRGAVLPLVAVLIAALAMLIAFVFDFSRAYAQKNELQTMVDATAHAGVIELYNDPDNVASGAYWYGSENEVLMRVLPAGNADVVCGVWDDPTSTFTPDATQCVSAHNAVRATVRDTVNWIFPLLMGLAPKQITATATAWMGYAATAKCVKPWGMNWQTLTRALDPGWPDVLDCRNDPEGTNCDQFLQKDPDRSQLDEEDLVRLQDLPRDSLRFDITEEAPPSTNPGNFGALRLPGNQGASAYRASIYGCYPNTIGPGDIMSTEPGGMGPHTGNGVRKLCTDEGNLVGTECQDSAGQMGFPVIAVLWEAPPPVGMSQVTVRQLVTFKIDSIQGNVIIGHFRPLTTGGQITSTPTTLRRPILVE